MSQQSQRGAGGDVGKATLVAARRAQLRAWLERRQVDLAISRLQPAGGRPG